MEIIELAHKRRAFRQPRDRYKDPYGEAMKLRFLWTLDEPPSRSRDSLMTRKLYEEALKWVDKDAKAKYVKGLVAKALKLDPKFHSLYALRGRIDLRQGNLFGAIKNYEAAKLFVRMDKKESEAEKQYNDALIESYLKRGNKYFEAGSLLEAASDYEQILILGFRGASITRAQDKLLEVLKRLDKYGAFRFHWDRFIAGADPTRASNLLTKHADYKIHLQDISTARRILFEALELNRHNEEAKKLLRVIYDTGHTMATNTVIWCFHGCYEKALLTIEKARDCDPNNPGYALLKTIVLRLCGRPIEAAKWLDSISEKFYEFHQPTADRRASIMGTLPIEQTRNRFVKQWYLIRYDLVLKYAMQKRHVEARRIIKDCRLHNVFPETHILLGDAMSMEKDSRFALQSYLNCLERLQLFDKESTAKKRRAVIRRIVDILNDRAHEANDRRIYADAIKDARCALSLIGLDGMRAQKGEALFHESKARFALAQVKKSRNLAADALRYSRKFDRSFFDALYGDMSIEQIIDHFASESELPFGLKIHP